MSVTLRVILLVVSFLTCLWIIQRIRKSQVKIEDSVFWILFSFVLVGMSLFPDVVMLGAAVAGVQSASNFVFLAIIFILLLKVFRMSVRISQLESKLQTFAQTFAIQEKCHRNQEDSIQ